jgi:hypothetical protein
MNYHIQSIGVSLVCFIRAGGEHCRFTEHRWRQAVRRSETQQGYAEWVQTQVQGEFSIQEAQHVAPSNPSPTPAPTTLGQ